MQKAKQEKGFTLLELLIAIGIIGILAGATTLVLNPTELTNRARDGKRISDARSIHTTLALYEVDGGMSFGSTNTVYISLADNASSTCGSYSLPSLPGGWSYNCVVDTALRNIDGTGWVPVDFSSMSVGSPIKKLPIDPINTASNSFYYTYVTNASWETTATIQSIGRAPNATGDGGDDDTRFEVGTNIFLTP